ncbi:MAG: hypothetical protein U0168_31020 [Nannocystaceae bacterium]
MARRAVADPPLPASEPTLALALALTLALASVVDTVVASPLLAVTAVVPSSPVPALADPPP